MGSRNATLFCAKKKMIEFMHRRQVTITPYANKTYHPKPKKIPGKRNLAQLTSKPNRSKVAKPRKVNVQKFPTSTLSQLNQKSTFGGSLIQEAIDVDTVHHLA